MNDSLELKESLLKRMLLSNNESISQIAREKGMNASVGVTSASLGKACDELGIKERNYYRWICLKHQRLTTELRVLNSDNGSLLKDVTMLAIMLYNSRLRVSNDKLCDS